ncbi:MAG: AAA family ATPase [Methylococcaceae bacterium]|nr:AAA family ATPase [Methylococcaceae bacterium]
MILNKASVLIQSIQNPALFPHKIKYFKIIETHISWVLLTGIYAYKIKKPLNLGFLDFSSLEKRRYFCHEEIRLNSRLAPDIYLDVVAIRGTEDQPNLGHEGSAIEYAVKMRQFESDQTFDQLLVRAQLTNEHLQQTAKAIAAFHSSIKQVAFNTEFGSASAVMQPVRENFSQILQLHGLENSDNLKHLSWWSEQQYTVLLSILNQRKQTGFIRECHGDLHLGNIALIDNTVIPFDGIDFNPSLYWIDIICDIAFLVMDLQNRQRNDLAFQFLNSYLQHSGDYAGLKVLHFYLVYRAVVMAKVSAIRANQHKSAEDHQLDISKYHAYLQLATDYTQPFTPIMIIMYGVSGSGKSWLSEQIINRYQAIRIRSDVERKRLQKLSAQQNSHSGIDSDLYSQISNDKTYQYLLHLSVEIISAGYPVIVDATFLQQQQRNLFLQQAKQLQVPFLIVHTKADKHLLIQRIEDRSKQQDNISDANQTVLENQLQNIQLLCHDERKVSITIDTDKSADLSRLWALLDITITQCC